MSIVGSIIGGALGLGSSLLGMFESKSAAKRSAAAMAEQRAATEAWYRRNYYQDYLNTIEARNAIKRVKEAWGEKVKEARARQAITGGTPAQAEAVAEAGGKAIGDTVGNLAAVGSQNRQAIDAQKLAMDNNLSQQTIAMAQQQQAAGANLVSNGIGMLGSSIGGIIDSIPSKAIAPAGATGVAPGVEQAVAAGRETRINPSSYSTPISTPQKELSHDEVLKLRGY